MIECTQCKASTKCGPATGRRMRISMLMFLIFSWPAVISAQDAGTTGEQSGQIPGSVEVTDAARMYGDYTVEDALLRLAGVQPGPNGQVNLLGLGVNRYTVSVNGHRLGSSGLGSRNVDLSVLSLDVLEGLEWIRVVRPDMDAEGLAGRINLITDDAWSPARSLSIRAGGGANPSFFRLTGPMSRGSLQYREALRDDLHLSVSAGYQNEYRGREGVNTQFATTDFGQGNVDVIERVSPFVQTDGRERLSGTVNLRYRPHEQQSYFFRAYLNNENRQIVHHEDSWSANGDWISPAETGAAGGRGAYRQIAMHQELSTLHHMISAGGEQVQGPFNVGIRAGWSRSAADHSRHVFPFVLTGRNMDIDMSNRGQPVMIVNNFNLQEDGSIDRQFMVNENFERLMENHTENRLDAGADITLPLQRGKIKAGINTTFTTAESIYSDASLQFLRILRYNRFNVLGERNYDILNGTYDLPWLLNTTDARTFVESQRPQFLRNDNEYRQRSEIWNYDVQEFLAAGYLMAEYEVISGLTLLGGIRAERVSYDNTGRVVDFGPTGNFIESTDTGAKSDGIELFPNAHIFYHPSANHSFHAAWSRTIQRPDFNILTPFELTNPAQELVFRGNPELSPLSSDNLDFFYRFRSNGSLFGFGVFAKSVKDFIYLDEQNPTGGDLDGWSILQYQNGDDALDVYGFDVSAEQRLNFLPGFMQHMALYVNYTYTHTEFEATGRDDELRMPGHTPHAVNAALHYAQGRFTAKAMYQWSAEVFYDYSLSPTLLPSINSTVPVYPDQFQNGWSDLSFSGTFRISTNFRFWADIRNLLSPEFVRYQQERDLYPVSVQNRPGPSFVMGIRYDI